MQWKSWRKTGKERHLKEYKRSIKEIFVRELWKNMSEYYKWFLHTSFIFFNISFRFQKTSSRSSEPGELRLHHHASPPLTPARVSPILSENTSFVPLLLFRKSPGTSIPPLLGQQSCHSHSKKEISPYSFIFLHSSFIFLSLIKSHVSWEM
jgi:hypothetical protein